MTWGSNLLSDMQAMDRADAVWWRRAAMIGIPLWFAIGVLVGWTIP